MKEKPGFFEIQVQARMVRALIGNHKLGAAQQAAETLRAWLGRLIDDEYKNPPELVTCASDPMLIVNSMIAHGDCAHPISMELAAQNLCTLLDQLAGKEKPATESEVRDGGDCICERCQQEEANGSDGLCQACRDAMNAQGVKI
jgi:hypothetical protein